MWRVWALLNVGTLGIGIWTGYVEMQPDRVANTNADAIFCTLVVVATIVSSIFIAHYSLWWTHGAAMRRASWRRFSINWWRDPLQCVFITCLSAFGLVIGAAFRLQSTSRQGVWMFVFFVCFLIGLLAGQIAVYFIYRHKIESS